VTTHLSKVIDCLNNYSPSDPETCFLPIVRQSILLRPIIFYLRFACNCNGHQPVKQKDGGLNPISFSLINSCISYAELALTELAAK